MENIKSVFETLNAINCNEHTEKKNELTYLSWAWAWGICMKHYPNTTYKVIKDFNQNNYHTDGRTCWVETSVTIEGVTREESLPIMDFRNQSIPLDKVTSFNVNTSIKRCLAKNLSLFGLGLYIYAGEDIPEEEPKPTKRAKATPKPLTQEQYNNMIVDFVNGKLHRSGLSFDKAWQQAYNPTPEEIDKFYLDANNYAENHTI